MLPKRILIIDDDEGILAIAKMSLELIANWEVLTAISGAKGIQMAREKQPDAILLDMMMPEMDGLSTFEHLHSDSLTQDIPVIVLTANVRSGQANGVSHLNFIGTIIKPFNTLKLADRIRDILGWT